MQGISCLQDDFYGRSGYSVYVNFLLTSNRLRLLLIIINHSVYWQIMVGPTPVSNVITQVKMSILPTDRVGFLNMLVMRSWK